MPWLLLLLLVLSACSEPPFPAEDTAIAVEQAMGGTADEGFTRAMEPREFRFPRDHGRHDGFQHEWWYFTGNLQTDAGRRFGYQITFFRIALTAQAPARESAWGTNHIWMAHVALSDIDSGRHLARERFSREAAGLAGASGEPLNVWVEDWRIDLAGDRWRIRIDADDFALNLDLKPRRGPVLQGDAGLSHKSAEPGNASYYYSIPRLASRGEIRVDGQPHSVQGLSWLDREWSTSALGPEQAGWDWFSFQLSDGSDLMYYQLRRKDGSVDPHSRGSLQTMDGNHLDLRPESITLKPLAWWDGPDGERYPIRWQMDIAPLDRRLVIKALLPDQLMDLTVRYWEGAVEVLEDGRPAGLGYLELAGY